MPWLHITFTLINKLGTLPIEITIWLFCCGYCYRAYKKTVNFLNSLGLEETECGKLDSFWAQGHIFIAHWSTRSLLQENSVSPQRKYLGENMTYKFIKTGENR